MEKIINELNNSNDPFMIANNLSIDELEKIITFTSDKYYNDESVISDSIWDMLIDFLRLKNKKSKVLKLIGTNVISKKKVQLPYYLGSMDKIKPPSNKINIWKKKYKGDYILSEKLDGVSALLVYNNNNINLYTRGTAKEGTDITSLLKYFSRIPSYSEMETYCKKNKIKGTNNLIAFRGELIISKNTFNKKWSNIMKNTRNTVSGLVNSKNINPKLAADTRLVLYEIVDPRFKILEQYKIIKELDFYTVHNKLIKEIDYSFLSKYLVKRKKMSKYDIDGIIVTNNQLHEHNKSGNPDYSFAFKDILEDQKAETKVVDIEWNISKDGYIKPTVLINSVNIGGVTIKRVTGNNAKFIKDNMISPSATIEIIRSGDVIPKIQKVLIKAKNIKWPTVDYEWSPSNVDIIAKNKCCKNVNIKNIYYFFSTLNTKGLGEKIVEKLYDAGIDTIEEVLTVKKDTILNIEGFKDKSAENLINSISKIKIKQPLILIMKASNKLGHGMGLERAKSVLDKYPNLLNDYKKWSKNDFINKLKDIDGWENKTSNTFVNNFPEFIKFYTIIKKYINIEVKQKEKNNGKYKDIAIVMSGFRDKELTKYLENEGAKITNSLSKNTDILIIKDKTVMETAKVKKAQELDIKIILRDNIKLN